MTDNCGRKKIRLSDINLSVRTSNCLDRMGVTTLDELASLSDADLLRQPNFGKKSLNEVKELLATAMHLPLPDEWEGEEDTLDFLEIEEPLLSTLLRPVQSLDLTVRAINVMKNYGVLTIGDLVQLTGNVLVRKRNLGKLTRDHIQSVLTQHGLSLGTTIRNWPSAEELAALLEENAQNRHDQTQRSVGTHAFLEDELCAAVGMAVSTSEYRIIIKRTGWDGGRVWTLEELAKDPKSSGRAFPVSRERIRQIEVQALKKVRKTSWSTPLLVGAAALIEEKAPLATVFLPSILQRHGIARHGLGCKELSTAMNSFQVEWDLVCITVNQDSFLVPSDQADEIERSWPELVGAAVDQDVVALDQVVCANRSAGPLSLDVAVSGVSNIPSLGWIDSKRRIFWSTNRVKRGWNKTINVCRKILTVVPSMPLERLVEAVKRARTVKDVPPDETFVSMLLASGEFEVDGGIVSRGTSFEAGTLSDSDQEMIGAAMDAGTVTTFQELRDALVRRGLSANHAQVLMVTSPFWVTTSPGKYKFVGKQIQLENYLLKETANFNVGEEYKKSFVELEVTHRHLVVGSHRIDEDVVNPGQWTLEDENGNDLGMIDVAATMIKGLDRVFSVTGVGAGDFVILDFSTDEFVATMLWDA